MWRRQRGFEDSPKRQHPGRTAGAVCCLMMVLVALPTVASPGKKPPDETRKAVAGEDLEPLRMNSEMARFLSKEIRIRLDRQARVQHLVDAIFNEDGVGITYGNQRTKTAIETFETGSGNCLSFTLLFVVMARHIGLAAYFQEVDEVVSWDRRGDVVLTQQHMFAEVEFDNGVVQVDLLPGAEKRYRKVRRISDRRAMAHFYNNLGVEALALGQVDDAIAWIRRALELDGKFGPAWSNLGVSQRRQGDVAAAEQSYLRAIDVDLGEVALNNLSSLYLDQGYQDKAAPLLARSRDYLQRNPYYHFRLAVKARKDGDASSAVRHLRQAIRRHAKEAAFHAALAEAWVDLGQLSKAIDSLEAAIRLADDDDAADEWRQQLTVLRQGGGSVAAVAGAPGTPGTR